MAKGIQIKKPDHLDGSSSLLQPEKPNQAPLLSPFFYLLLIVSFPAALVAFYFYIQIRSV